MPWLCVTKMSATPVARWRSLSRFKYWSWMVTSRFVVGSSAMMIRGPPAWDGADDALPHPAAHLMRVVLHPQLGRRNPHGAQQLPPPLPQSLSAQRLVVVGRLGHLVVDREQRIQ